MMIDVISKRTILVGLCAEDMERYSLDLGSPDIEASRAGLARLMARVGSECGLRHEGKSYLIEALPGGDGCLLIVSVRDVKKRRVYRIKRKRLFDVCFFSTADDMLDCLKAELSFGFRLYGYGGGYCLRPELPAGERLRAQLSEYGSIKQLTAVGLARVTEVGELIFERSVKRPKLPLIRNNR